MRAAFVRRFGRVSFPPDPLVTEYLDADELTHDWANLTGWNNSNVQVSSNRLYGVAGGNPAAAGHAFSIPAGFCGKVTAEFVEVTTSPSARYIGLNFGGTNNGVNASLPNFIGAGFTGNTKIPQMFIGSNFTGVTTGATNLATGQSSGTYRTIITIDELNISVVVRNQSGTAEWSATVPRSSAPNAGAVTSIIVWNGATNGTSGSYIKAIGAKASLTPFRTKSNAGGTIEGNTSEVIRRDVSDVWRIQLPKTMNGLQRLPVVLFTHQAATGTADSPMTESRMESIRQMCEDNGFILLSADDDGDRWGNSDSLDNYDELVTWVKDRIYCGPLFLFSPSMGGGIGFSMIMREVRSDIVAIAAICPVCDLVNMYENPTFTASLGTAYSASDQTEFETNIIGFNPVDGDPSKFASIGVRFYTAVSGDTIVPNSDHVDIFRPLIAPYALESDEIKSGTSHLASSQYDADDVLDFFSAYL